MMITTFPDGIRWRNKRVFLMMKSGVATIHHFQAIGAAENQGQNKKTAKNYMLGKQDPEYSKLVVGC